MDRYKKILFVIRSELNYDNAPSSRFLYLANELSKLDFDTKIIGVDTKNKTEIGILNKAIIPMSKNTFGWGVILRFRIFLEIIKEVINKKRPQFIIIREPTISVLICPILRIFKVKIIVDFHGYRWIEKLHSSNKKKFYPIKYFEILSLKYADLIISVSKGVSSSFKPDLIKKTIILENGINLELFNSLEKPNYDFNSLKKKIANRKVIGFLGDNAEWYNMTELFEATNYLDERIIFVVIGKGYQDEIVQKYKSKIIFLDRLDYKVAIYLLKKFFDVSVVPYSKSGRCSNIDDFYSARKVKEYLAAGKPIIISDIKGRESYLKENENVIVYEAGNPQDLALKISKILSDTELYKIMSKNNVEKAKEYTWSKLIQNSGLIGYLSK